MLNSVNLQGRLAQAPELRYTQGGVPLVHFDLAVEAPSRDKNTPPDYFPIVCWREQAEFVTRYLTKGRQIVVEGKLTTNRWTDREGHNRKDLEITANRIHFAGNKEPIAPDYSNEPAAYDIPPEYLEPPGDFMNDGY